MAALTGGSCADQAVLAQAELLCSLPCHSAHNPPWLHHCVWQQACKGLQAAIREGADIPAQEADLA